jgi:uncharacterized protein YodC (DUF2158 family)
MTATVLSLAKTITKEPATAYAQGDVVGLRSGGAQMTVREFRAAKGKTPASVDVDWMNDSGDPVASNFPIAMVDLILAVDEIAVKVEIDSNE